MTSSSRTGGAGRHSASAWPQPPLPPRPTCRSAAGRRSASTRRPASSSRWRACASITSSADEGDPLVLLHGNTTMSMDFLLGPFIEMAARKYRVIVFDRPGYGWSERPRGKMVYGPQTQARLIHEALAQVGVERPIVHGHSWGAMVAMAMGLDYPEHVRALVLESGYWYPDGAAGRAAGLGAGDAGHRRHHALHLLAAPLPGAVGGDGQDHVRAEGGAGLLLALPALDGVPALAASRRDGRDRADRARRGHAQPPLRRAFRAGGDPGGARGSAGVDRPPIPTGSRRNCPTCPTGSSTARGTCCTTWCRGTSWPPWTRWPTDPRHRHPKTEARAAMRAV
jgi:pimeloyl-ACP methyl ester carboxylesterase